jgi:small-conductance mechanosensitive channel
VTFLLHRVVPAAAVLVVGVILAFAARSVALRLLGRVLPPSDGRPSPQARSAARGLLWFLLLATVVVATSLLAPDLLADVPAQVVRWLPRLGVALVLLWLGAIAASLLRQLVQTGLERIEVANARLLGQVVYWVVLGLAILMAADELGVRTGVLQTLLFVLLVVAGVTAALAVGLGGWTLASNVIAGRYVEDRFTVGQQIEVDQFKGTIVEVGLASVTIADADGALVEIPHGFLLTRPVRRSDSTGPASR